jgi:hypothetical protein
VAGNGETVRAEVRMRKMLPAALLTLAAAAVPSSAGAQPRAAAPGGDAGAGAVEACSLLTKAEVERAAGRRFYDDPEPMRLAGGSVCAYGTGKAQIILFSGERSGERLDALIKNYGHENAQRHPVPGVGDGAYVIYPRPRNQYEDRVAFIVVRAGRHALGISLAADGSKPAEAVQPNLVELAKAVVAKLR